PAVDRARGDLAQAGMPWLSVETWIALRVGASLVAALIAYLAFGVLVLGVVASLACYHLLGLAMEHRRRSRQLERQQALLDSIRYGAAVVGRGGHRNGRVGGGPPTGPARAPPVLCARRG